MKQTITQSKNRRGGEDTLAVTWLYHLCPDLFSPGRVKVVGQ